MSGFFWRHDDRVFLVSNWHCFSGIDPDNGQAMHTTPDRFHFVAYTRKSEPDEAGYYEIGFTGVEVVLRSALTASPLWLEHPTLGRKVDVAAIDVTENVSGGLIQAACANVLETDAYAPPSVSQDVFIIGYPLGPIQGAPVPVWKRGTIATDPTFDPGGLPMLYVDTATRPGMSGSLVLVRQSTTTGYNRRDGTHVGGSLFPRWDQILGIYSGAMGAHHVEAQLGVVWKRQVIEETIAGQSRARI